MMKHGPVDVLVAQGLLTEQEFAAQKAMLLGL
jgi:hypothetical protein